ncbi:MAG: 50S ribosomal protein L25, partial [Planctomycetes bacterium]|nr:50S ribosomal protein L25 [Planctomycetota bacterium]
ESVAIALPFETIVDCLKRNIRILNLDLAGTQDPAIIKDLQWDGYGDNLMHVDLMRVRMDEEVSMSVSLASTGRAKGIDKGGILTISRNEVTLKCLPSKIPDVIEFDVSDLGVGDSLSIKDLILPEGVTLDDDPEQNVASVTARIADIADEGPQGQEGEEAGGSDSAEDGD